VQRGRATAGRRAARGGLGRKAVQAGFTACCARADEGARRAAAAGVGVAHRAAPAGDGGGAAGTGGRRRRLGTAPPPDLPIALARCDYPPATQDRSTGCAGERARRRGGLPRAPRGVPAARDAQRQRARVSTTGSSRSKSTGFPSRSPCRSRCGTNGQRELALSRARASRDVARAIREDKERAVQRDVTPATTAYLTARAAAQQAAEGLLVARENYRVQQKPLPRGRLHHSRPAHGAVRPRRRRRRLGPGALRDAGWRWRGSRISSAGVSFRNRSRR